VAATSTSSASHDARGSARYARCARQRAILTDDPHPDVITAELLEFGTREEDAEIEKQRDFRRIAFPIFRRESIDRKHRNADIARGARHATERDDATTVSLDTG